MQDKRLELDAILRSLDPSLHIYFQPPVSIKMQYPAIVYKILKENRIYADNKKYKRNIGYDVTFVHFNPDDDIFDKITNLDYCSFNRRFVNENLYHDSFTLYY